MWANIFHVRKAFLFTRKKSPALDQICFIVKDTKKTQKGRFVFTLYFLLDVMYSIFFYLANTFYSTGMHRFLITIFLWSHIVRT